MAKHAKPSTQRSKRQSQAQQQSQQPQQPQAQQPDQFLQYEQGQRSQQQPHQHEQYRQQNNNNPYLNSQFVPQYQPMPPQKKKGHGCLIAIIIAIVIVLACFGIAIAKPSLAQSAFHEAMSVLHLESNDTNDANSSKEASEDSLSNQSIEVSDSSMSEEQLAQKEASQIHTCRLLAQCQGVDIYSPVPQDEITGVLMHQASYEWGQVMTTELPDADMEELNDGKPLRVNNEQTEGLWVDADAAHLYRETDSTEMDTSIDCGAKAGTTLYSPVTGTVIAVTNYDLYDEIPDVRIHIRPDANPDLDVVLLHQTDPMIKAGDKVEAGVTPISKVRDIAADLTDVQLSFYTEDDDPGNHSHIQVNDLNNEAYIEKYLKDVRL